MTRGIRVRQPDGCADDGGFREELKPDFDRKRQLAPASSGRVSSRDNLGSERTTFDDRQLLEGDVAGMAVRTCDLEARAIGIDDRVGAQPHAIEQGRTRRAKTESRDAGVHDQAVAGCRHRDPRTGGRRLPVAGSQVT